MQYRVHKDYPAVLLVPGDLFRHSTGIREIVSGKSVRRADGVKQIDYVMDNGATFRTTSTITVDIFRPIPLGGCLVQIDVS